jgi:copper chaperone CopZ
MTCSVCPITIRKALERVQGAAGVKVDLDKRTATVTFDPDKANAEALVKATAEAGYPASVEEETRCGFNPPSPARPVAIGRPRRCRRTPASFSMNARAVAPCSNQKREIAASSALMATRLARPYRKRN